MATANEPTSVDFGLGPTSSDRLQALERRARRLQILTVVAVIVATLSGVLAVFAGWTGWAARFQQRLSAREFLLAGPDGVVRARWEVTDQNGARLAFYDAKGAPRLRLTVQPGEGGAGITLADAQGHARVVLGLLSDETGSLVFADGSARTRAVLGLSADQAASVVFADQLGVTRAGMGVDRAGAKLLLSDSVIQAAVEGTVDSTASRRANVKPASPERTTP
jgi:hypothetical protein